MYKFLSRRRFSSILGIYLEELLDHVVTLCLTIWGTARLFSTVAAPFSHQQGMSFPIASHPYQHLLSVFLIIAILVGMKCYLEVLICNPLMTNDIIFSCDNTDYLYWQSVYIL